MVVVCRLLGALYCAMCKKYLFFNIAPLHSGLLLAGGVVWGACSSAAITRMCCVCRLHPVPARWFASVICPAWMGHPGCCSRLHGRWLPAASCSSLCRTLGAAHFAPGTCQHLGSAFAFILPWTELPFSLFGGKHFCSCKRACSSAVACAAQCQSSFPQWSALGRLHLRYEVALLPYFISTECSSWGGDNSIHTVGSQLCHCSCEHGSTLLRCLQDAVLHQYLSESHQPYQLGCGNG